MINSKRGYVLIDVLLALTVVAIFAGGFTTFFRMNRKAQAMATETMLAARSASSLIELISNNPEIASELKNNMPEGYDIELKPFHSKVDNLKVTISRGKKGLNNWSPVSIGTLISNTSTTSIMKGEHNEE